MTGLPHNVPCDSPRRRRTVAELRVPLLAAVVFCLAGSGFAADRTAPAEAQRPKPASATQSDDDFENLLYLADDGLIVFRMRILVDGKGCKAAWRERIDAYFDELDANKDAALTGAEAAAIPSYNDLIQAGLIAQRYGPRLPTSSPNAADNNPRDGRISRDELAAYFEGVGLTPFSIQISSADNTVRGGMVAGRNSNSAGPRLFELLDGDDDKKLSNAELKAAWKVLRKSDLDDDETISAAELSPPNSPFVGDLPAGARSAATNGGNFMSLSSGEGRLQVVRQLMQRLDKDRDGKLDRNELKFDKAAFDRHDADGDGSLDFTELARFLRNPRAGVEMVVRMGKRQSGEKILSIVHVADERKSQMKQVAANLANLRLRAAQIDFSVDSAWRGGISATSFDSQFDSSDADNNGYIDKEESRRNGFFLRAFDQMDADRDGKIFKKELHAYVRRQSNLAQCRTMLAVSDQGRDLFKILDLNGDGRLSPEELESLAGRINTWDVNEDGYIALGEVPSQYRVTVERGSTAGLFGIRTVPAYSNGYSRPLRRPTGGPKWFIRMDLNSDGEVLRREFLGPLEAFDRLDADANGRLSPEEAYAAGGRDKAAKAKKPVARRK